MAVAGSREARANLRGRKLGFIGAGRAYFCAGAKRCIFIWLPEEDREPGKCGRWLKSARGARGAANHWEDCF
eukprot:9472505-Pyramimonas_sp.AAC.1